MKTFPTILALLLATIATHAQTSVVPKSFSGAKQPQVTITAPNDDVFVTFGRGDSIYVACSTNYGKSFESPRLIGTVPKLALGMRRGPRIVGDNNDVIVTAISHEDGNLYSWTSKDRGAHWNKAIRVNDSPGAAREGLHAMAICDLVQIIAVAWLDLRNGKTELHGSVSHDLGKTWSKNFLIYRSPDGHICECCHPSLAFRRDATLVAMWRNWLHGTRDMYTRELQPFAESNETGPFDVAQKLGTASWKLQACPMDGGSIACNFNDAPVSVWRRESKIVCWRNERETVISESGSQPCLAVANDSFWIVYQNGDKLMSSRNGGAATILAERGKYPTAAGPLQSRKNLNPICVWETNDTNAPIAAKILP